MKKEYGLIGFPLSHSFSKEYFTKKFYKDNINAQYYNIEVEDICTLKEKLKNLSNILGMNVTIPHKKNIIPFLDEKNVVVEKIQACNCIKIKKDKWIGYNTDIIGFKKSFIKNLQQQKHKSALVFGYGGASLAVIYILEELAIPFSIVSRKENMHLPFYCKKFEGFINYNNLSVQELQKREIFINTTPLGMYPNIHTSPLHVFSFVTSKCYFYDLIYNPLTTLFLKEAGKYGAIVKNGLEMLEIQAEESYKIWTS